MIRQTLPLRVFVHYIVSYHDRAMNVLDTTSCCYHVDTMLTEWIESIPGLYAIRKKPLNATRTMPLFLHALTSWSSFRF